MRSTPSRPSRAATAATMAVSLAAVLAACGGGSSSPSAIRSSISPATTAPGAAGGSGAGSRRGFPGVVGSVAAITGTSMEVQNPSTGQTTVSWTGSTTFEKTVQLSASSVAAGDCVTVIAVGSNGAVTARSVAVSAPPSSGSCPAGRPFGGAGRRAGPGGNATVPPRTIPAGAAGRFGRAGATFASGRVVSSSASSLVLLGSAFTGGHPGGTTPPTTAAPSDITVAVTSSTVFTELRPATSASLAVGDCVAASGPADSTGAVTARSVRITSTGGGSCTGGFGRFAGGGATPASASANA